MKFFVNSNFGFLSYAVMERQLRAELERRQLLDDQGLQIRFGHIGMVNADILVTTWETTKVPRHWVKFAKNYKLIIVGSRWNLDIFKAAGILNVICIPFGIDDMYHEELGKPLSRDGSLLFFANNQVRKGLDVLEAVWLEFFKNSSFKLVIVGRGIKFFNIVRGDSKLQGNFLVTNCGDNVMLYEPLVTLSTADIKKFYLNSKTLVLPSRSEGYGLTVLEALSCGCNVVLPDYSSTIEFEFDNCFRFIGFPEKESGAEFGFGVNGQWWEPDRVSLAAAINKSMNSEYVEGSIAGDSLPESIRGKYSWGSFVNQLLNFTSSIDFSRNKLEHKSIPEITIIFEKVKFKLRRFIYKIYAISRVIFSFD